MIKLPPLSELLAVLPATVVAGVLLLVTQFTGYLSLRRAGVAVSLGIGSAVAIAFVLGRLPEAPGLSIPVTEWPFHIAVVGIATGIVLSSSHVGMAVRGLVCLVASAGVTFVILGQFEEAGSTDIAVISVLAAATWFFLDRLAERRAGATVPIILSLVSFLAAEAMVHGQSGTVAQMAGGFSAACGAAVVMGLFWPQLSMARGGVALYSMLMTGCLAITSHYDSLPRESAALLVVAPLAAWIGETPLFARRPAAVRIGISALIVAAISFAAVVLSYRANPPDEYGYF